MSQPLEVETIDDDLGTYTQRWMCTPPDIGVRYAVTRQEWNDDYTTRTIHEIRLV